MQEKKYQATLNLPQTDFPMRANLKEKEVALLARWEQEGLYKNILNNRQGAEKYILHDGPPYANGHIHIGHALNKILKDIIVKSKTMMGYSAPYVPGWDCHGLPIEYEVLKEARAKKETLSPEEIRRRCRVYAMKFVDIQREEFKRLGVLGDWDNPYLTMTPDYEAAIVREFGKVVESGGVYKAKKPVLWCPYDETALAEAEVEYADITSPAIYVKFRVTDNPTFDNLSFIIWTTTPWTLVANKAVCLHPKFDYDVVRVGEEHWVIAKSLVAGCMKEFGIEHYKVLATYKGADLEGIVCRSPFLEQGSSSTWPSPVILGDHVTLEQGTGCVHTAPGHGREDYQVGMEYGLDVFAPVDSRGRFTDVLYGDVFDLRGIDVLKTNALIQAKLSEIGTLVHAGTIAHTYPHCWRCKKPVIFRATEQWFISMTEGGLRDQAVATIENVKWIPDWGKDRILGMMKNRPDWCISRQRSWGVPIVAFSCTSCGELRYDEATISHVADQMEQQGGADIWFSKSAKALLPEGTTCKCGGETFNKENDILDVWFESGVSYAAVLEGRAGLQFPANLYLEGSDQHRGWFHSSLLASISSGKGRAPYNAVLTHGFTVDGAGKKMSKSSGNVVAPQEIIGKHGAEILRLWVAATDFRDDVKISNAILDQLVEAHRKIRNTCRFLLSNLYDYDPRSVVGAIHESPLLEIDRWALHRLSEVQEKILKAYNDFEFHTVFHTLNQFCSVDLSTFYLDIIKDRLYASSANSPERRAAQAVLSQILVSVTRLMAPILSFTAEEIWPFIPAQKTASVHLSNMGNPPQTEKCSAEWDRLIALRNDVNCHLEKARGEKQISSSLGASVRLHAPSPIYEQLQQRESFLPTFFIVSQVDLVQDESMKVAISQARGIKCERCWIYAEEVGDNADHPTLCKRCSEVVGGDTVSL